MKIYLAGKVDAEQGSWRDALLGMAYDHKARCERPRWELFNHGGTFEEATESYNYGRIEPPEWPQVPNTHVLGIHDYVGPYRLTYQDAQSKSSGYFHGTTWLGQHGMIDNHQDHIVQQCIQAMSRADLIFAYINSPDCFGTLTEIGMARTMGKYIALVIDDQACWDGDDYWFIQHLVSWSSVTSRLLWSDDANGFTRPEPRDERTFIRDHFRDALVQWTASHETAKSPHPLALVRPDHLQQAAGEWYRALGEAKRSFAQISQWSSDPRVRAEADRMRRLIAG